MRLFVAVPVPEDIRKKVSLLGNEIAQDGVTVVRPENMHLTLKFIGEVEEADSIKKSLIGIKFRKFDCVVRRVGVFPNENYVKVVWAGIDGGSELDRLAAKIKENLIRYKDTEKFSAHLTIARVKRKLDVGAFLAKHKQDEYGKFTATKFELIQSILGSDGPKYITLATFSLE
ncbi:RNA 2',3'-cyclic phosphodiesterase [Candidatus Bilamarchaeum dharawalense]|uniref:RNA 2',3'-cyclic phosphodiesterase n=1 Tax=Candidatus Bilamarchaeum dharawalense TaxID=2885759 RepID=A0A5E4LU58_9ARCH|nr:RNA 2',3'-cyclic phosphodiesterase [Candidatus Bilamarchaeum dharawalense]